MARRMCFVYGIGARATMEGTHKMGQKENDRAINRHHNPLAAVLDALDTVGNRLYPWAVIAGVVFAILKGPALISETREFRDKVTEQITTLEQTNLRQALEILGRRTSLFGLDLSGSDLRESNLSGVDLGYVNLSEADLSDANLSGANFGRTNLQGATLNGANFEGATLPEADISGAKLEGAINLTQEQVDSTCAILGRPDSLPVGLVWNQSASECTDMWDGGQ